MTTSLVTQEIRVLPSSEIEHVRVIQNLVQQNWLNTMATSAMDKFHFGHSLLLTGDRKIVIGYGNTVIGNSNWVFGMNCAVEGHDCFVLGFRNNVEGDRHRLVGSTSGVRGNHNRLYGHDLTSEGDSNESKLDLTALSCHLFLIGFLFSLLFPGIFLVPLLVLVGIVSTPRGTKLGNAAAVGVGAALRMVFGWTLFSLWLPLGALGGTAWWLRRPVHSEQGEGEEQEEDHHVQVHVQADDDDDEFPELGDRDHEHEIPQGEAQVRFSPSAAPSPFVPLLSDLEDEEDHFLLCPISHEPMRHPVTCVESGHTYERDNILAWWTHHDTDPMTNLPVSKKRLVENKLVKQIIVSKRAMRGKY